MTGYPERNAKEGGRILNKIFIVNNINLNKMIAKYQGSIQVIYKFLRSNIH